MGRFIGSAGEAGLRPARPMEPPMIRLLLLACALVSGCSSTMFDPRYSADTLVFDEGLLGVWVGADDQGGYIAFAEKRLPLDHDGRLDTSWPDLWLRRPCWDPGVVGPPPPARTPEPPGASVRIYEVVLSTTGSKEDPLLLNGYLSRIDGVDYLGVQLSFPGLLAARTPVPLVLPTHTPWKIERGDGVLTVAYPARGPVVLALLGGELDDRGAAEGLPGRASGMLVFDSIDRLQAYYRKHAGDRGFRSPSD
jgi:hypothetical protein